jgi:TRAP-type C4-dicarboxylate transport system permease small subunit
MRGSLIVNETWGLNILKKFLSVLDNFDKYLAIITLSTTITLLGVQVFSRYVFKIPIAWAEEISRFTFVWAVYMGVSMAARSNDHIRVVAHFKILFPENISKIIIIIGDLVTLIFSIILTIFGVKVLFSLIEFPFTAPVTGISMVWIYTIIPIAFLSLAVRTIQTFFLRPSSDDSKLLEEAGL